MRGKMLWVETLERRDLLAALWSGSVGEPVQTQERVQVQECVECCQDPVQAQAQTQTQQQDSGGEGPVQNPVQEQAQTQTQQQDGDSAGPVQDPVQDKAQAQTQTQQQDGNCDGAVTDAAIESLVADDADPLRQRSGEPAQDDGNFVQQRDGTSW